MGKRERCFLQIYVVSSVRKGINGEEGEVLSQGFVVSCVRKGINRGIKRDSST